MEKEERIKGVGLMSRPVLEIEPKVEGVGVEAIHSELYNIIVIFRKITTFFNLEDMFRCC